MPSLNVVIDEASPSDLSPLHHNLLSIYQKISLIGWLIAFLTFVVISVRAVLSVTSSDGETEFGLDFACQLVDAPVIAVILILIVGGEGPALVVSMGLSNGIKEFMKNGLLVKKLQTIESLAYCDEIVTDKTGTMTRNEMNVVATHIEGEIRSQERDIASQFEGRVREDDDFHSK